MPEAAVHEDGHLPPREYDVWTNLDPVSMNKKIDPKPGSPAV
jgi:hypothetical protein